jgi:hypothetical protein
MPDLEISKGGVEVGLATGKMSWEALLQGAEALTSCISHQQRQGWTGGEKKTFEISTYHLKQLQILRIVGVKPLPSIKHRSTCIPANLPNSNYWKNQL